VGVSVQCLVGLKRVGAGDHNKMRKDATAPPARLFWNCSVCGVFFFLREDAGKDGDPNRTWKGKAREEPDVSKAGCSMDTGRVGKTLRNRSTGRL